MGRMQRNELVTRPEVVLNARKQMRFPVARPRRAQHNTPPGLLHRNRENIVENLIGLAVHRVRMRNGKVPERFEKRLERMLGGHGMDRST